MADEFKPDKVASVGGDGTTLFTSIALLGAPYPIGIVPMGSANGMAAELYVDPDPVEALKDIIMSNVVKGLDLTVVNGKHYTMHIGDVGINANIVDSYSKDKNRGMKTYAKYFVEEVRRSRPFPVTVRANGITYEKEVLMVGICNSRKYGTGVPLNITGSPMDGKFEIVLLEYLDVLSLIKAGLSKFDEKYFNNEHNTVIETTEAEITFDRPRLLQLDGETIGEFDRLKIDMVAGAVPYITHYDNLYARRE